MALTPSNMLPLGTLAPGFSLPNVEDGREVALVDVAGAKGTVVMFICNHCPYVKHVNAELVRVANDYGRRGIGFVAISSNDAEKYPEDGPVQMKDAARLLRYPFPYLYDETQQVAKEYQAACTPDIYLFDASLRLVYRGQLDDTRPGKGTPDGRDLRAALEAVLGGKPVSQEQKPSVGCNIKWKPASVQAPAQTQNQTKNASDS